MPVEPQPSSGYPKGGTVAVVSCGPTAAVYEASPRLAQYDVVIGCRSVPARVRCDFWCVADWQPIGSVVPIGKPILVIRQSVAAKIEVHAPESGVRLEHTNRGWKLTLNTISDVECIDGGPDPPMPEGIAPWWTWSGTAALGMAWRLNPREVDLYGVDLCGIMDVDGRADEYNRSDDRWEWERQTVDALVRALRDRGAAVWFAESDDAAKEHGQA